MLGKLGDFDFAIECKCTYIMKPQRARAQHVNMVTTDAVKTPVAGTL